MNNSQRGVAIVAVMWIVSALAILASVVAYATRVELRQTQLLRDRAVVAALGDGAINLAIAGMQSGSPAGDGLLWRRYTIDGTTVHVRLIPATGLINLNTAPETLLRDTFQYAAGINEEHALSLAHRVIDWRDADDDPLPQGAENEDYYAAGRPEGARNGLFVVNEDLRQVLGLSPDIYDSLSGLINVYPSGNSGVNPAAAPPEVLAILARGNDEAVQHVEDMRQLDEPAKDYSGLAQEYIESGSATVYRIEAYIQTGDGQYMSRVRWVDITRGFGRYPWQIFRVEPVIGVKSAALLNRAATD